MSRSSPIGRLKGQGGAALLIVLLLLLIITVLGLVSLRGTLLEERMSSAQFDRSLMFQAAEAALRQGEAVAAVNLKAAYSDACTNGLCARPNPAGLDTYVDRWLLANPPYVSANEVVSGDIKVTPQYFIEYMGDAPNWPGCDREIPVQIGCMGPRYRVTARARAAGRSEVLLQTSYTAPE